MRKSMNLVLAAGLAASAFSTVAAAEQRQAKGCDNPDERVVITDDGLETQVDSGPVPGGAPIFYVYTYVLDIKKKTQDVAITISWDNLSDYDLEGWFVVGDEESERQESLGDQLISGDESVETVTLEDVPDCAFLKVGVQNYLGDPTHLIDLSVEVG